MKDFIVECPLCEKEFGADIVGSETIAEVSSRAIALYRNHLLEEHMDQIDEVTNEETGSF